LVSEGVIIQILHQICEKNRQQQEATAAAPWLAQVKVIPAGRQEKQLGIPQAQLLAKQPPDGGVNCNSTCPAQIIWTWKHGIYATWSLGPCNLSWLPNMRIKQYKRSRRKDRYKNTR
jgi:hypothetical protein